MKSTRTNRPNSENTSDKETNRGNNLVNSERSVNPENTDEEFPGYPHYPTKEDIMHPSNRMEKISPDPENLTRSGAYIDTKKVERPVSSSIDIAADSEDELIIVPGTDADVTKEDLVILGALDIESDEEQTLDTKILSGDLDAELDVPGEELDDTNEALGEEDEENNYYSLGGDRQENLEEN